MTSSPVFSAALRRSALSNTLWPIAKQGLWALALLAFALNTSFGWHGDSATVSLVGIPLLMR